MLDRCGECGVLCIVPSLAPPANRVTGSRHAKRHRIGKLVALRFRPDAVGEGCLRHRSAGPVRREVHAARVRQPSRGGYQVLLSLRRAIRDPADERESHPDPHPSAGSGHALSLPHRPGCTLGEDPQALCRDTRHRRCTVRHPTRARATTATPIKINELNLGRFPEGTQTATDASCAAWFRRSEPSVPALRWQRSGTTTTPRRRPLNHRADASGRQANHASAIDDGDLPATGDSHGIAIRTHPGHHGLAQPIRSRRTPSLRPSAICRHCRSLFKRPRWHD